MTLEDAIREIELGDIESRPDQLLAAYRVVSEAPDPYWVGYVRYNYGDRLGLSEDPIPPLRSACERDPSDLHASYLLACALFDRGRREEALERLRWLLKQADYASTETVELHLLAAEMIAVLTQGEVCGPQMLAYVLDAWEQADSRWDEPGEEIAARPWQLEALAERSDGLDVVSLARIRRLVEDSVRHAVPVPAEE